MTNTIEVTSKIEAEILALVGLKPRKDRAAHLVAMLTAVSKVSDAEWKGLSEDAQNWYNAAQPFYNDGKPLPDFPDIDQGATEPAGASSNSEETDVTASKKAAKPATGKKTAPKPSAGAAKKVAAAAKTVAASKPAKPAPTAKTNGATPRSSGEEGAPTLIRRAVIDNPSITSAEIVDEFKRKGIKCSNLTVSSIRSATVSTLRMLKEKGHLKGISV